MILEREWTKLKRGGANAGFTASSKADSSDGPPWDDDRAAVNRRRLQFLSDSLLESNVHDLQALRSSLERQAADGVRPKTDTRAIVSREDVEAISPKSSASGQCEAYWDADLLGQRITALSIAVERKGGWRSAMFLSGGEVNVDVDVGPWSPADGARMLQTVRSALVVQLEEVCIALANARR